VVEVPVGVDEEAHRLVRDLLDGREDLGRERRELIVDHHHAVVPGGDRDVPAFAFEHVKVLGDLGSLDLDRVEVLGGGGGSEGRGYRERSEFHALTLPAPRYFVSRGEAGS
jgi:hypothetical protein